MLVVAPPSEEKPPEEPAEPEPSGPPATPVRLFPETGKTEKPAREELLDMLARRKKTR
jgi:hypothetical protein